MDKRVFLSQTVYNAGMSRIFAVFGHQQSVPRSAKDPDQIDPKALRAWYDEFVAAKWTDDEFKFCLPFAMMERVFSQPIAMLSGPRGEWRERYDNLHIAKIERRAEAEKDREKNAVPPEEVKEMLDNALKQLDEPRHSGLSGQALEDRRRELLSRMAALDNPA